MSAAKFIACCLCGRRYWNFEMFDVSLIDVRSGEAGAVYVVCRDCVPDAKGRIARMLAEHGAVSLDVDRR